MSAQVGDHSHAEKADDYSAKIDRLLKSTSPRSFNGVILVTKNRKERDSKAFAYSDLKNEARLRLEDNFRIISNRKQITAVLILREVDKGKIELQSPARRS